MCSHNWWDSVANRSSSLAFADFGIFSSRIICFFWYDRLSASSCASRDRSERCCWLRSREDWHIIHTASITIWSEAFCPAVFPPSLEQSRIGAKFTASVLIIPRISLPCQVHLCNESMGSEKCWRPGYCGTDVNRLSTWSFKFLASRYLSSQRNKSWTQPRSSWCNWSGCERR